MVYNLHQICCVCLAEDHNNIEIIYSEDPGSLHEKIKFSISSDLVILESKFPKFLCTTCHTKLNSFYVFKQMCFESNARLKDWNDFKSNFHKYLAATSNEITAHSPAVPQDNIAQFDLITVKEEELPYFPYIKEEVMNELLDNEDEEYKENITQLYVTAEKNEASAENETYASSNSITRLEINSNSNTSQSSNEASVQKQNEDSTDENSAASSTQANKDIVSYNKSNSKNATGKMRGKYFTKFTIVNTNRESCTVCTRTFKDVEDLKVHVEHHINNFTCEICNKTFCNKFSLRTHLYKYFRILNYKCHNSQSSNEASVQKQSEDFTDEISAASSTQANQDIVSYNKPNSKNATGKKRGKYFTKFSMVNTNTESCTVCNRTFKDVEDLKVHVEHHINNFTCEICNKTFSTKFSLRTHLYKYFRILNYKCHTSQSSNEASVQKQCEDSTDENSAASSTQANKDIVSYNKSNSKNATGKKRGKYFTKYTMVNTNRESCTVCNRTFKDVEDLKVHVEHHINNFTCEICNKTFSTKFSLRTHLYKYFRILNSKCHTSQSSNEASVQKQCEDSTDENSAASSTQANKDIVSYNKSNSKNATGKKRGKYFTKYTMVNTNRESCTVCNRTFKEVEDLKVHVEHHINNFTCEICNKTFINKFSLRTHLYKYFRILNYKCPYCEKAYTHQNYITRHIQSHFEMTQDNQSKCLHCYKIIATEDNLDLHLKAHFEIKEHKCQICGKAFKQRIELEKHLTLWKCVAFKSHLERHLMIECTKRCPAGSTS